MNRLNTNGIREQVSAANRSSTSSKINDTEKRSVVIYDYLGKIVTKTGLADLVPEENIKRSVFNINTGNHWIINKIHKNQDEVIWRTSATEMDNQDDTHCFGANFRLILFNFESALCLNSSQNMQNK